VLEGLRVLNENNWFPAMTLIVGNPGETDQDVRETIDLVYEIERRGCLRSSSPRSSRRCTTRAWRKKRRDADAPAHAAAVAADDEVLEDEPATGQYSWWGPMAWRVGSIGMWLYKLRRSMVQTSPGHC
jgi:hypothetical protein